jgi:hypothetical protein
LVGIISIMGIYWIIDVENLPSMMVENDELLNISTTIGKK